MEELVFQIPYKNVEDIPREEYKNLFKQYWTFIASNKLKYKPPIYDGMGYWVFIIDTCFACEYAFQRDVPIKGRCKKCPLVKYRALVDDHYSCFMKEGPYQMWRQTGDPRFAMEIAQLEWED